LVALSPNPNGKLEQASAGNLRCIWGDDMKDRNFATMSVDELWNLHEKTRAILSTKLGAEMQQLERRLAQLTGRIEHRDKARRPYPKVHPKYRNPERPSETWSGRGKQPRWVNAHLSSGRKVEDLLISRTH
jgi:DNA-binding protein H-NS